MTEALTFPAKKRRHRKMEPPVKVDGRSVWSRRYSALVAGLISDAGGEAELSTLQIGLIKRAAALSMECERLEAKLCAGEAVDVDQLARTAGHLRRLSETLGLQRKPRDVTLTVDQIARRHKGTFDL